MSIIDSMALSLPAHASLLSEIQQLARNRHWHQLALAILQLFQFPEVRAYGLLEFYEKFIKGVQKNLDQTRLVRILHYCSQTLKTPHHKIEFLLENQRSLKEEQSKLIIKLMEGILRLQVDDFYTADSILTNAKEKIAKMKPDEILSSFHYKLALKIHQFKNEPDQFYSNALQYLAYPDWDHNQTERFALCCQMATAVLISQKMYNFSELLQIPVLKELQKTQNNYFYQLLQVFNRGSVTQFNALLKQFDAKIKENSQLNTHRQILQQKIRLMSFLDLLFKKPKNQRTVTFTQISQNCFIDKQRVQLVVMRAMALDLINGSIDQVKQQVRVNWIVPRVLDRRGIEVMGQKYKQWSLDSQKLSRQLIKMNQK